MSEKSITLLSVAARSVPAKHQYYRGFKNVVYLTGHIHSIEGSTIWLQLTNNLNLLVPVAVPPGIRLPRPFKVREAVKMICQVQPHKEDDGEPGLRVYARSFERPNVLELPNKSAFEKAVPDRAPEDREFRPYGSGYRASNACNQVKIAGMVVGISVRKTEVDPDGAVVQSGACTILLRQDADEENVIPVKYYGKLAETVASYIKPGDMIYADGKYRVKPVEIGGELIDGKPKVRRVPFIQIQEPALPTAIDIVYIGGPADKYPAWMIDMHQRFKRGAKRAERPANGSGAQAAPTAASGGPETKNRIEADTATVDLESHPLWASLSPEHQKLCREDPEHRKMILGE
ncbi:single-stranded DNA-binding protein [Paraburkholderia fungorum]|uniref:Single-stranded DNA-binding protein n=1 Tax=Paraburkholderia fungorum TaxID=134537 RepID=A0AAP5QBC3_9BURK|nr:hypothetical protein [Paraburkholderia fungorum]MDT8840336.1 single-stranded DNA-binding protein [Paraburkholderia fungorum]